MPVPGIPFKKGGYNISMASAELLEFIVAAKTAGAGDQFLVDLLRQRGWQEKDIYQAFSSYYEQATRMLVPGRPSGAESARDAFLYLLAFSTLSTWAWALAALSFTLVDRWLPDPIQRGWTSDHQVASSMAAIIVAFPIYLWVTSLTLREAKKNPEKLQSGVRKWLTYLALLLAAAFLIGDLVTLLTYFLRGEISGRFVTKVAVVLVIAGGIFGYYLESLRPRSEADEQIA